MLNPETVQAYIDLHKEMKLPFKLTITNYTSRIQSNFIDIHFMKTEQSNRVLCAFSKVKSQVIKKPVPKIKNDNLQYFSQNFKQEYFYAEKIFNIDIKSAYVTILLNNGYIDKPCYDYVNRLPKMERLAAVGMLAGKKNIFTINKDGEIISDETIISKTSDYFFYCVKETSKIINEASQYLGEAFLFSWVDGIYFIEDETAAIKAMDILKEFFESKSIKVTNSVLTDFSVTLKKSHYHCIYKSEGKTKTMNVPVIDDIAAKKITNYLLKKDYNNGHN